MEEFTCTECGSIFKRYRSQVRDASIVTCSTDCRALSLSRRFGGADNPNYKDGTTLGVVCLCGGRKDHRSSRCADCANTGYPTGGRGKDTSHYDAVIAESSSIVEAAGHLKRNRKTISQYIVDNDIDVSHMVPRGERFDYSALLTKGSKRRNGAVRRFLLKHELIPYICAECGMGPEWNGRPIVLPLDHVNGNPLDNRIENLRFLCPNCHWQTPTFGSKNKVVQKRKEGGLG